MAKKIKELKVQVPTVNEPDKGGWRILTTALGCGSRILQGWSSGIGIHGNDNFEEKMFYLLYGSKNQASVTGAWTRKSLNRDVDAPIAVGAHMLQFLQEGDSYVASSTIPWVDRFEAFVKKHNLGELTRSHVWKNAHYKGDDNITFLWTWNGNVPNPKDVGVEL